MVISEIDVCQQNENVACAPPQTVLTAQEFLTLAEDAIFPTGRCECPVNRVVAERAFQVIE